MNVMTFRMMRLSSALLYVGFFLSVVSRTEAQAPGDGDPICTDEFLDGMPNPFFALRPTYTPNERPLMDSRDYVSLLQGEDNIPWQTVDNDNNTAGVATAVSGGIYFNFKHAISNVVLYFPVVSTGTGHLQWISDCSLQWSYGVTVWEIFTCGKVPYHGISCMALPGLLRSGEHLEKLHNAACSDDKYVVKD